ncbi:MAG TPA: hypothetical protein VF070_05375 [Streptosporangiaceae bacterium]
MMSEVDITRVIIAARTRYGPQPAQQEQMPDDERAARARQFLRSQMQNAARKAIMNRRLRAARSKAERDRILAEDETPSDNPDGTAE